MKKVLFVFVLLVLTAGIAGEGLCQPPGERPERKGIRKKVGVMRVWELTKALDLDEETASRLFPVLNEYDRKRTKIHEAVRADRDKLKVALNDGSYDRMKEILGRLERHDEAMQQINQEERAELKNILTVKQQARFVLFHREFRHRTKRMLAEKMKHRAGMD